MYYKRSYFINYLTNEKGVDVVNINSQWDRRIDFAHPDDPINRKAYLFLNPNDETIDYLTAMKICQQLRVDMPPKEGES